jgi:uncharacterized membrane protein
MQESSDPPGTGFMLIGWGAAVIGVGVLVYGFSMEPQAPSETQQQTIFVWLGFLGALLGGMMAMTGHLIRALNRR